MVRFENRISQSVFDYLGVDRSAALCGLMSATPDKYLNDGVLWVQYNEENSITGVAVADDNGVVTVFSDAKTDFEELSYLLGSKFQSTEKLPYRNIDKKYLMRISEKYCHGSQGDEPVDSAEAVAFDLREFDDTALLEKHLYEVLTNSVRLVVIYDAGGSAAGSGLLTDCRDFSFISDVSVNSNLRGNGYGSKLIKKMLWIAKKVPVYLICEERNVRFYEKAGFEAVGKLYEYKAE